MAEIKTYRVTINNNYIIGVHATSIKNVIDWLGEKPQSIKLLEKTGDFCKNFNTCLALYNSN